MRAQISLWMLTKFGMIFFIITLSAIIMSVELRAKDTICEDQTNSIANAVAGRLTQVLESPAEDEQRTYAFPGGLSLGRSDRVRYFVNITNRETLATCNNGVCDGRLIISVWPASGAKCEGASSVPYKALSVDLQPGFGRTVENGVLQLSPSDVNEDRKSFYLVILKCGNKVHPPGTAGYVRYLYVKDCTSPDISACNFFLMGGYPLEVEDACGFPEPAP